MDLLGFELEALNPIRTAYKVRILGHLSPVREQTEELEAIRFIWKAC